MPKCYFEETRREREVRAKKAAERKKHNAPTQRGMSTDERPRKQPKQLHRPLTAIHHTNIHEVSPTSHEFDDYLLDLHQPDPMVPPREEAWPSSDVDHTDSLHDSDVTHDLDNDSLGGVPDIDLDAVHDVVDASGDQASSENRGKVIKGRKRPGDRRNVDPGLDAFINANLLPEGDPRRGCRRLVLDVYFGNIDLSK